MKSKRTQKKTASPPVADSMKSAASLYGIPSTTLKSAKAAGCPAFVGSRIHRDPLLAWLKKNPEIAADGATKSGEAELKVRRLAAQVALLELRVGKDAGSMVPRDLVKAEYARATAIFFEEAKALMEVDHYRVFCERTKGRVGEVDP